MGSKIITFFTLLIICSSCSTNYYFCRTSAETLLYSKNKLKGNIIANIPSGEELVVKEHYKYQKVKYKEYLGWINTTNLTYLSKSYSNTNSKTNSNKIQTTTYSSGTVNVKGYFRKDGTYVRPHTRSKPKSYKRKKY